jgi:hypothetical protein
MTKLVYLSGMGGSGEQRGFSRSLVMEIVPPLAAFITVVAATVYALGVFVMWLSLRTQIDDFSMSWHAVSLIPRNVVIGQGVKALLWPTLATAFVLDSIREPHHEP